MTPQWGSNPNLGAGLFVIVQGHAPSLATVLPNPPELAKVVDRCLRKDPARRWQHIDDVKIALAEINQRVDFLYFHASEVPNYDEWMAKKEAERGTAIKEIRKMSAARKSGTAEFKQSLEYVDPISFAKVPEAHRSQKIAETQKAQRRFADDGARHP